MSSSMVYGDFNSKEVSEETKYPIGIYGTLKYSGELLVKSYNQVFDLPYTIIRRLLYMEKGVSREWTNLENAIQNMDIKINGSGEDKLDLHI